jgi:hypothetical protein
VTAKVLVFWGDGFGLGERRTTNVGDGWRRKFREGAGDGSHDLRGIVCGERVRNVG